MAAYSYLKPISPAPRNLKCNILSSFHIHLTSNDNTIDMVSLIALTRDTNATIMGGVGVGWNRERDDERNER